MRKENGKKALSILLVAFMTLAMIPFMPTYVKGATPAQIEASCAAAVAHFANVQNFANPPNPDGSWGQDGEWEAKTGLVLLKLESRAIELGLDPFDNDVSSPTYYQYANNVIAGMNYLLSTAVVISPLPIQVHGPNNDDPDTNGNGQGIRFGTTPHHYTYVTGIALSALAWSAHPNDKSYLIGGISYTYKQIAQDAVDWLIFAQGDAGNDEGGWSYNTVDNNVWTDEPLYTGWTDNSNSGYAILGLAFAEDPPFSCIIPPWVRRELNIWITTIQDPVNGDLDDGGSWYNPDYPDPWVNVLKTGNLIFEMAFYGDSPSTQRVKDAVDYLERHWQDPNWDPGWGYSMAVANYQAKFLVEKGLTYMGIDKLDTDGDGIDEDWYNQEPPAVPPEDFASVIIAQQQMPTGNWPLSDWDYYPDAILSSAWAVLALEKIAPPPEFVKRLVPEEGGLGTVVHVTISVHVEQGQTVTVVDTLPTEFNYISGSFKVNGVPATPTVTVTPPPKTEQVSYSLTAAGNYLIEFDIKVTSAYWEDRTVINTVVGTWYDEQGNIIEEKEATANFLIHAFEQLRKRILHEDWPMFHHDLALSGVTTSTAPDTNATLWVYDTGSSVQSSPAVVDGKLYVGALNGKLYALDANTGAVLWTYETGGSIHSSPAVAYDKVYFLSTDGGVYALNAITGAFIWASDIGANPWDWSSPAVNNGRVFIGSAGTGQVYSLDAATGAVIWNTPVGGAPNGPIAVVNGKVYSGTHNFDNAAPTLVALDEITGAIVWTYNYHIWHGGVVGMINSNGVSVADGDGDGDLEVYFGVYTWDGVGNTAICLDEATGVEVWTQNINGMSTSTPAVHNGVVFIGSDDNKTYALNAGTGAYIWNYPTGANIWSAPAVADGKVFVASLDHIFYALDETTGSLIWKYDTLLSRMEGSPAVACGRVFVGNENGKIYAWGSLTDPSLIIKEKTNVQWKLSFEVTNPFPYTMTDVEITDRFGAELEIDPPFPYHITDGVASYYAKGASEKIFLTWTIGNLLPGKTAQLIVLISTDTNPGQGDCNKDGKVDTYDAILLSVNFGSSIYPYGDFDSNGNIDVLDAITVTNHFGETCGKQEYTESGTYELNSGATLKFIDPEQNTQLSAVTDSIYVTVLPAEDP